MEKRPQKMAGILNICGCIYNQSSKATADFRKTAVGDNVWFFSSQSRLIC